MTTEEIKTLGEGIQTRVKELNELLEVAEKNNVKVTFQVKRPHSITTDIVEYLHVNSIEQSLKHDFEQIDLTKKGSW